MYLTDTIHREQDASQWAMHCSAREGAYMVPAVVGAHIFERQLRQRLDAVHTDILVHARVRVCASAVGAVPGRDGLKRASIKK